MGLLDRLKAAFTSEPEAVEAVEYKGYRIYVEPRAVSGGFGIGGRIERDVDGELRQVPFIRADQFPTREVCSDLTLNKAKQAIDQLGDRIFG